MSLRRISASLLIMQQGWGRVGQGKSGGVSRGWRGWKRSRGQGPRDGSGLYWEEGALGGGSAGEGQCVLLLCE